MTGLLVKEAFGWGFVLWFIGYLLGILLFAAVSPSVLGWVIMPIGIVVTLWVLFKKIHGKSFEYFLKLGVVWTIIAVVLDYLLLVLIFKPTDGYYKLDVYLYYVLTFILPVLIGWYKNQRAMKKTS